jgi:hypothetical protein
MPDRELADLRAATAFVESLVPRADGLAAGRFPYWFGWAVRDAYLAGVRAERERTARLVERECVAQGKRVRPECPEHEHAARVLATVAAAIREAPDAP